MGQDEEKALQQKSLQSLIFTQSGRRDLNPRPPEPHSGALPGCATSRSVISRIHHAALASAQLATACGSPASCLKPQEPVAKTPSGSQYQLPVFQLSEAEM